MKFFSFLTTALIGFFNTAIVFAAEETKKPNYLEQARTNAKGLDQLSVSTASGIIGVGIRGLMMFMGAIMFALVIYAGFLWMMAQGNGEKIEKAKNIIVWAGLGVTIMLVSYIVVNFVFGIVGGV